MRQFEEMSEYDAEFNSIDNKINISDKDRENTLYQINKKMDRKTGDKNQIFSQWKYYVAMTTTIFILILLALPFVTDLIQEQTGSATMDERIHEILSKLGYDKILHQEIVDNGVVVFYIPDIQSDETTETISQLGAIFIEKTLFGWKETNERGGYSTGIPEPISHQYLPGHGSSSFPMVYGEINDSEIAKVKVISENSKEYHAKTITTENHVIWFVLLNNNLEKYQIQGLSETNKIVTSINDVDKSVDAVTYNEGLFQYKDSYVGDNSAVLNIIGQLRNGEDFAGVELKTKDTPYGMILDYDELDVADINDVMKETTIYNATYLFSLVMNADWITFSYVDQSFTITRDELDRWYGEDLSKYTNENDLNNLIHQHLEDEDKIKQLLTK